MSEPILKVEGVQAKYGDFVAVEEATPDVPQGIIVSVIGANGAGKSTLMDTIAGVHKPTAGTITFKGEDITGMPAEKVVLRGLSLLPQGSRCFIRMTVEDNLVMGSYPKAARAKVKDSLERVYELFPVLKEKRNDLSGSLSGGQRQALTLLMATIARPKLLLLDEHTAALDPAAAEKILAMTTRIAAEQKLTCLMVTHNMRAALALGNRTLMMNGGQIILDVSGEERTHMDVDDLLKRFRSGTGKALDNDRILLS